MENSINQFYLLCIFTVSGLLIGILFDSFRILRKSFKTPDIITYIEDILFWVLTGAFLLYIIFKFSFGEIRIYMFACIAIGFAIYILTLSKYFISLNVKIIKFIKNIIRKIISIIIFPFNIIFKLLKRLIFKPITFITINVSEKLMNFFKNFVKKFTKFTKNKKNTSEKKDFPV